VSLFEIRTNDALTVLVEAADELHALEIASDELLTDGTAGSVLPHDGRPVGADGTDAEEPDADPRGPDAVLD